jgi:hypothetical protein
MEAARTSETSVDIDLTRRQYITEDSELQPAECLPHCFGTSILSAYQKNTLVII